jgi:hypothetical protein
MDYNMPASMASIDATIRGARGSRELRIIGVSSSTNRLLSARFLKVGGNDFMLRPFIDEGFIVGSAEPDTLVQIYGDGAQNHGRRTVEFADPGGFRVGTVYLCA